MDDTALDSCHDRQRPSRPSIVSGIAGGGEALSDNKRRGSTTSTGSTETSSSVAGGGPSGTASSGIQQQMEQTAAHIKGLIRRASQVGADDVTNMRPTGSNAAPEAPVTGQSEEDTMKNLRKTFAGIFGDM